MVVEVMVKAEEETCSSMAVVETSQAAVEMCNSKEVEVMVKAEGETYNSMEIGRAHV